MIIEGRVSVNGKPAMIGMKVDPAKDFIKVDGKPVTRSGPKLYFAFHKPKAVMSTLEDPEGRPTVKDFLRGIKQRVYPVGRLDYHSEGLLLITNDGEFANLVLHPARKIPKTYEVKVKGTVEDENLEKLRGGIKLEDGMTLPAKLRPAGKTEGGNSWLQITIHEGRKRQIRRMFDKVGHPVLKLKRTSIGGIKLGALEPGGLRPLTGPEIEKIVKAAKSKEPSGAETGTETRTRTKIRTKNITKTAGEQKQKRKASRRENGSPKKGREKQEGRFLKKSKNKKAK